MATSGTARLPARIAPGNPSRFLLEDPPPGELAYGSKAATPPRGRVETHTIPRAAAYDPSQPSRPPGCAQPRAAAPEP